MTTTPSIPEPPDEPNDGASLAANYDRSRIKAAYAGKLASGALRQDDLDKILWLDAYARAHALDLAELSRRVGYKGTTTLYRVFRAEYDAGLSNALAKIAAFKVVCEQRRGTERAGFVATSLSALIAEWCNLARAYQCMLPIYGNSQTGKTTALVEFQRANPRVVYVPMPAGGGLKPLLQKLCKSLALDAQGGIPQLTERVIAALTQETLLIIDEVHQVCLAGKDGLKNRTVEHIRLEIFEPVKCGIILCGTNVFRREVEGDRHGGWLGQTRQRGMYPLQLPPMLPRPDMDALAAAYGLPPAADELHALRERIVRGVGLGAYINFIRAGSKLAVNRKQPFAWGHFVSAHDALAKLAQPVEGGAQ